MSHICLNQSHKTAPSGKKIRELSGNKQLTISLMLPSRASDTEIQELIAAVQSGKRPPLSLKEREAVLGARPQDIRKVMAEARKHGLKVHKRDASARSHGMIRVTGTYARFQRFLPGVELHLYNDMKGNPFTGREGSINVLSGLPIQGVFGLDDRDVAHTNYQWHEPKPGFQAARKGAPSGLTSRGLAALQGWNLTEMDKLVRVTGFLSLGGDLLKIVKDLETLCKEAGIETPEVKRISTDGVENGSYRDDATVENALDLFAQALVNPSGAVLQFQAENSDDAFAGAAEAAIAHPGIKLGKRTVKLSVLSISWGMAESGNTQQSLERWARIAASAQLAGIDIVAATGDTGPKDSTRNYTPDAPSCVGKGRAVIMGAAGIGILTEDGETISEIVPWNDSSDSETGYGISAVFPPTELEQGLNLPVSAETGKPGHSASVFSDIAQPASGPVVLWNKRRGQVGGTSHSAPLQGAKMAFLKTKYGITSFTAFGYANGPKIVDKITRGDSSAPYPADPGADYNVMTGFGVISEAKVGEVASR
ncbi:MAG: hypothetical protein KC777_06945 [Cyanobacteria bacterium HKST-UBA02]|nr:hypothetical protein [Cyanobacteria bacterium HKST-UBA02]